MRGGRDVGVGRSRRVRAAVCVVVLAATAACSTTVTGAGRAGSRGPGTGTATTTPGPQIPSFPSSAPATGSGGPSIPDPPSSSPVQFCGSGRDVATLTNCLRAQLSDFWSGQLNDHVEEPVFLHPQASQVPADCRSALSVAPAFTCRDNLSLYITDRLLTTVDDVAPGPQAEYAFASVLSHEIGHVLQYTLRQPQIEAAQPTDAQLRFIEQQADCLSGVWAHDAAAHTAGFDPATFVLVAKRLISAISTNPEIRTHGTPDQRAAALARGLRTGRPQTCRLVTFS